MPDFSIASPPEPSPQRRRGRRKAQSTTAPSDATIGYEAQLWKMADALRGSMDAAEYKHVVLGLIFLKYISDAFEEQHAKLEAEHAQGADPEDPDEYRAANVFWVPPGARWSHLKADFTPCLRRARRGRQIANPPFNGSDSGGERLREDKRWRYGVPPVGNANFAWVQHIIHHLAPAGVAGFVLANGSMSSNQSGEGEIRKNIIEADLVDCMVALPGQLFYSTQIPACLWFLARDRSNGKFRDRRGEILFIDARKMGRMVDRTHRELTDDDIARIATTYHAWRGEKDAGEYHDLPGFCKSATLEEIRKHGYVLTPGRYVGAEPVEDDGEPFEEKMARLVAQLREQQAEAAKPDSAIVGNI